MKPGVWYELFGGLVHLKGEHASVYLTLNDHTVNYKTVAQHLEDRDNYDWVSEDSKQRAIETNRLWVLHWYPRTPISFYCIAAATLGEIVAYLEKEQS